jgi:hypothetical protein
MRLPDHLLKAIQDELRQRPNKWGTAYMAEYQTELRRFEANMSDQQNYNPALMNRIAKSGERLRKWFDDLVQDREAARRKKER